MNLGWFKVFSFSMTCMKQLTGIPSYPNNKLIFDEENRTVRKKTILLFNSVILRPKVFP